MKFKKAEVRTALIIFIIAIAVFVLVVYLIWKFYGGEAIPFFSFLPTFGQNATTDSVESIRYDIINDRVQYYDGLSWKDFKDQGQVELGKKKLLHETVRKNFAEDYYYKRTFPYSFNLISNRNTITNRIYTPSKAVIENFNKEGAKIFVTYIKESKQKSNYFLFDNNNILLERTENEDEFSSSEDIVGDIAASQDLSLVINTVVGGSESSKEALDEINGMTLPFGVLELYEAREKVENKNLETVLQKISDDKQISSLKLKINLQRGYSFNSINSQVEGQVSWIKYQLSKDDAPIGVYFLFTLDNSQPIEETFDTLITVDEINKERQAEYLTFPINQIDSPERQIINDVLSWRNSVFQTPVQINLIEQEPLKFCPELYNNKYIVVDLTKPTEKETCP